tara:strand:+ start:1493 stop:2260 length:768 start_codon:yes stop_codon:yes gene_type:complete
MLINLKIYYFTKVELLSICKKYNIKKVSRLNKADVLLLVNKYFAIKCICNFVFHNRKIEYVNDQDPISLCDIRGPCIELEIKRGKVVRYNPYNIYEYMLKTGNFSDPFTGNIFSDKQIKIIDDQLKKLKINKISLFTIKYDSSYKNHFKEIKDRENQILGLDRQIGEIIVEIQELSENIIAGETIVNNSVSEYYYDLINNLLPNFSILFRQLSILNSEYAKNSGQDYICTFKNSKGISSLNEIVKKYINDEINMI